MKRDDEDEVLTPDDVADRLHVPRKFVLELARRKEIRSFKVGRYVRFRRSAVTAYERKQEALAG